MQPEFDPAAEHIFGPKFRPHTEALRTAAPKVNTRDCDSYIILNDAGEYIPARSIKALVIGPTDPANIITNQMGLPTMFTSTSPFGRPLRGKGYDESVCDAFLELGNGQRIPARSIGFSQNNQEKRS